MCVRIGEKRIMTYIVVSFLINGIIICQKRKIARFILLQTTVSLYDYLNINVDMACYDLLLKCK